MAAAAVARAAMVVENASMKRKCTTSASKQIITGYAKELTYITEAKRPEGCVDVESSKGSDMNYNHQIIHT